MLVSVIIPFFNCGSSLTRTIKSVMAQSYSPIEVIMIDDGSTDDSYSIAKNFECTNIKVFRQINLGASVARNLGIANASGTYFQFLDAGDVLSDNKIEIQVNALSRYKRKLAVCDYAQFTNDAELKMDVILDQSDFIYSTENPIDFLISLWGGYGNLNFIPTNCWLVPRELIEMVGGWRNYRCPDDDGEFFARIILASNGIIHTENARNYYHIAFRGENQLSQNKNVKLLKNLILTIDLKHKYLEQKGGHKFLPIAIGSQYLRFAVFNYPQQIVLSKIAFRRYKKLNVKLKSPVLGGIFLECTKYLFGWRVARWLRFIIKEQK
jgi:glycosyltransferase involved in cell wall biosynthesis